MYRLVNSLLFTLTLLSFGVSGAIKLPHIYSSNMVLQRGQPVYLWGWADKGEKVKVVFNNQTKSVSASASGEWVVTFPAMQAGGPYTVIISGKKDLITLTDVLIGDVWICSGQSNMEWVLKNTKDAEKDVPTATYANIRLFTVEKSTAFVPKSDVKGGPWVSCSPRTAAEFSAVGYYFGRNLSEDLKVPIGLISTSWGGTNIEAWTSWPVMASIERFKSLSPQEYEKSQGDVELKREKYQEALKHDKGDEQHWYDAATVKTDWLTVSVPGLWEQTPIGNTDGIIWFSKTVTLPESAAGKSAVLHLGPVDDWDETYVNGKLVGKLSEYNLDRVYSIQSMQGGVNSIVVKVTDTGGGGGIYGKPAQLFIDCDGVQYSLVGEWQYKPSVTTKEFGVPVTGPNEFPSQLYNAMIAPLIHYPIKGAIWYQGESNAYGAYEYQTLFPNMIRDWRSKWGYEFPFYWVQLANYMSADEKPSDSDWAELREAQTKTLSLPQTGQAVIIDIGEAGDIHPRNKKDVGYRLAVSALNNTYKKDIVGSGPTYQSMKVDGNSVILTFNNVGQRLVARDRYGYVRGFAIAGADNKFVWAKAKISGNNVIVYADEVPAPKAVRYAWGNNPDDANLYNDAGLPACPFRTDDLPMVTKR